MVNSSSAFAYFLGGLTLAGLIVSAVTHCCNYLPSTQLALFDRMFLETREVYECAKRDNLIANASLQTIIHERLSEFVWSLLHTSTVVELPVRFEFARQGFRDEVYRAMNILDDIKGLLKGLTVDIMEKSSELRRFRSWLTVSTNLVDVPNHAHTYLPDDEPKGTQAQIGTISFLSYHIYARYSR